MGGLRGGSGRDWSGFGSTVVCRAYEFAARRFGAGANPKVRTPFAFEPGWPGKWLPGPARARCLGIRRHGRKAIGMRSDAGQPPQRPVDTSEVTAILSGDALGEARSPFALIALRRRAETEKRDLGKRRTAQSMNRVGIAPGHVGYRSAQPAKMRSRATTM